MEKRITKWSIDIQAAKKKSCSSTEESNSNKSQTEVSQNKKEVNSWDCSTPNDKNETPKEKISDWDNSECQETVVEPFDNNENLKDDNWDSESEKCKRKGSLKRMKPNLSFSSFNSYDLSNPDFSDIEKMSLVEQMEDNEGKIGEKPQEDLFVEDLDEFVKNDGNWTTKTEELPKSPNVVDISTDCEKVRSQESEGTPEDTTIWMIPKSERTQSGESTSKLISSSDREKLEKLKNFKDFLKKTKSLSDMHKIKICRKGARSSRSECSGPQKNNYNNFLLSKGSDLKRKLEIESMNKKEKISSCEGFDRTRVFFTEYECRTMTMDKGSTQKLSASSRSVFNNDEEILQNLNTADPPQSAVEKNINPTNEADLNQRPGTSGTLSVNVNSLSDMTEKNLFKECQKESNNHEVIAESQVSENSEFESHSAVDKLISESWFLLDDTGQYQTISRNEVSVLLNGRSADAVLQGRKEHFIPSASLRDTKSLKSTLSGMLAKKSVQHVLKEDDIGGEDERQKLIDLERKVENTLFYIQPGMNLTASIRIIPVDTEMIHLWRTARDGGSVLSSEIDLLDQSQDLMEGVNSAIQRPFADQVVIEENDDIQFPSSSVVEKPANFVLPEVQQGQSSNYSKLLIETRIIVDSLTSNFKILQNRLDGETNRNMALQGEVNKLRLMVKNCGGKYSEKNSREAILESQPFQSNLSTSASVLTLKTLDKNDLKSENIVVEECQESPGKVNVETQNDSISMESAKYNTFQNTDQSNQVSMFEDNDIITVNIYTVESTTPITNGGRPQETYSLVQSNLRLIENKMKHLQQQNDLITKQNVELKKKLKEISMELEKYLASPSEQDSCIEESKELESLRDQVCNLKLELETLKMYSRSQEEKLVEENSLIRDEFSKLLLTLKDWFIIANEIFQKVESAKSRLLEIGITVDLNLEQDSLQDPKTFFNFLTCYLEQTAQCLVTTKNENFLYEQTLKDVQKESNTSKEISGLDQVISGYSELIDQCRKGQITAETKNQVMEDYFTVIMEKATLMEEIKILKTENEMLLESQLEHYEKLKQTMMALKDRKSEIIALESSQKLSDEEKYKMVEVLKIYEEEKNTMETEILEKSKSIDELMREIKRKDLEVTDWSERLRAAVSEINNLEKSCQLKDELINELKTKNDELLTAKGMKNNEIEIIKNEVKNLEMQKSQLDSELTSTKLFISESQKEMTDYITHLEALVNNSQESLEKTKQKLKESSQTISRLKNENDVLDKQHQCDLKLFNNTKDELESCKEKLTKANNKLKEWKEEREKLLKKCDSLASSEKEKSEALDLVSKECKILFEENADLKRKVDIFSKDKDELLKEQKDLINKYALISKEIQKLQDKYRSVKTECNDRTDLIRYLEQMLKENILEYNNRIACLEQNVSRIIEKIIACKNGMREKHFGVDSEVRELRQQLNITYQERKELENVVDNYYSLMKRLENEVLDRERKVDELHMKLTLEQQKAIGCENERKSHQSLETSKSAESLKIERLENEIAITDNKLAECKKELQLCQINYENEKKKLELTIVDLKSEIKRYQLRIEVMMRNLSNCGKNGLIADKRNVDDSEIQTIKKEILEKNKIIAELNDALNKLRAEIKLKESDLENMKKKSFYQTEELNNLQNQMAKLHDIMTNTNKSSEMQQKERDEMAEKLFQSIKLIMEERSARQAIESLAVETEKNYKNNVDQIKNQLVFKEKECKTFKAALEDKNKLVSKLQEDLKKIKTELASLRVQVGNNKKRNCSMANGDCRKGEEQLFPTSFSLTHIKPQNVSPERLESCMKELKEIRELNLELRKTEGQYQAKIVRLEDEIRDARLLIKELQGDIKTEKRSKKALKNMILAAKMEIEKCLLAKQLMSVVADRICRHLDLSEIPSRELLSGFRLSDSSSSSKICT